MTKYIFSRTRHIWPVAFMVTYTAFGQILQDKPELCARPGETISVPTGVSATTSDAYTAVSIMLDARAARVEMPGVSRIEEVCPLSGGRLLVFGLSEPGAYDIYIVSTITGNTIDSVDARSPAVSPNQHWLARRPWNPPSSDLNVSDQYLLYDLTGDRGANRVDRADPVSKDVAGRVMYPAVPRHLPFRNYGVRPEYVHTFQSDSFFWSLDSTSVVFAD